MGAIKKCAREGNYDVNIGRMTEVVERIANRKMACVSGKSDIQWGKGIRVRVC